jgi:hypothetical protein
MSGRAVQDRDASCFIAPRVLLHAARRRGRTIQPTGTSMNPWARLVMSLRGPSNDTAVQRRRQDCDVRTRCPAAECRSRRGSCTLPCRRLVQRPVRQQRRQDHRRARPTGASRCAAQGRRWRNWRWRSRFPQPSIRPSDEGLNLQANRDARTSVRTRRSIQADTQRPDSRRLPRSPHLHAAHPHASPPPPTNDRLCCRTITRSAAARKRRPLQRAVSRRPALAVAVVLEELGACRLTGDIVTS